MNKHERAVDGPCAHCARLDQLAVTDPPESTQFLSAREYRELTGHWPSCKDTLDAKGEGS